MDFLRFLEGIRIPVFNYFFAGLTYLGDEIMFIAIGAILYWCVSKRYAYYIFAVGLINALTNQTLKLLFQIPRPWVIDPEFSIVEAARGASTGYSFPSGHTQNAVGVFGAMGLVINKKWLRAVCFALIILIPFSRMYLGVHTPLDVGIAFAVSVVITIVLYFCFNDDARAEKTVKWVLLVMVVCSVSYLLFTILWKAPADIDRENLASGMKSAYILTAATAAIIISYILDKKFIHFKTDGSLITQIFKALFGLGITLLLKSLLKTPIYAIVGETFLADGIRYFIVALFATCLWPLTFPLFRRLCERKKAEDKEE